MPRKAIKVQAPPPPLTRQDIYDLGPMGLRVVSYQREACDGFWLPRDMIGADGKTLIRWETDDGYAFHGWSPWHDGMFGGRYQALGSALAWVRRAREVRAGTAANFLGV